MTDYEETPPNYQEQNLIIAAIKYDKLSGQKLKDTLKKFVTQYNNLT